MTATPSRATSSSSTQPELNRQPSRPPSRAGGGRGDAFWSGARPDQRAVALGLGGLVALAWIALALWGLSPHQRYLDHGSLDELRVAPAVAVVVFVAAWTLMIVAMMLPTAYPVVSLFASVVGDRPERRRLLGLCVVGYLAVWAGFGAVAHVADAGLHAAVEEVDWLHDHPWVIGVSVLALAGTYQFSDLKYRCLDACRSPRMFILRRWRGRNAHRDAMAIGVDSGLYCLGCCWSLMLVMFAAGAASFPLMLGLGTAMAAEKNLPWGARIRAPLGITLLAAAAIAAVAR